MPVRRGWAASRLVVATVVVGGLTACSASDGGGTGPAPTVAATLATPPAGGTATGAPPDASNAAQILARAQAKAAAARSGAFTGTIDDEGEQAKVTFAGTRDGSAVDVTKSAPKAGRVHLISLDGSVYVKADDTFWSSQNVPFIVSLAGDRFVKAPAGVVPVLDELTLKAFVDRSIGSYSAADLSGPVLQNAVGGQDCWVLTTGSGKPADGALYVSKDADEVLRYVGPAKRPGRLDFSRWDADLGITAPPADQVFSIG